MPIRERTGTLIGQGGVKLFYRVWEPEAPAGSMVLSHGMNEHSGRYAHVAAYFAERRLAVYALDHRGHGRSQGPRCHVDQFRDYLEDLRLLVIMARAFGQPILLGHSMGGLIAFRYAVAYPETLAGLVLTSPYFRSKAEIPPLQAALAPLMSRLLPRFQMPVPSTLAQSVCRDPEIVNAYIADPLVGSKATPRWFTECTRAGAECPDLAPSLQLPALFLQAGGDLLVDPEATRAVFTRVGHDRKSFKLYPGRYHEILNDPGKEEVLADIDTWLRAQVLMPEA